MLLNRNGYLMDRLKIYHLIIYFWLFRVEKLQPSDCILRQHTAGRFVRLEGGVVGRQSSTSFTRRHSGSWLGVGLDVDLYASADLLPQSPSCKMCMAARPCSRMEVKGQLQTGQATTSFFLSIMVYLNFFTYGWHPT